MAKGNKPNGRLGARGRGGSASNSTYEFYKNRDYGSHNIYYNSYMQVTDFNGEKSIAVEVTGNSSTPNMVKKGEWFAYSGAGGYSYIPKGDPSITTDGLTKEGTFTLKDAAHKGDSFKQKKGQKPSYYVRWGKYTKIS